MTGQEGILKLGAYEKVPQGQTIERMCHLLAELGNPETSLSFVQVGGSNGKGSVSAMLYAIVNRCEYRGGLFSYPHLSSMHQRICVDGEEIPDDDLGIQAEKVLAVAETMATLPIGKPSELELSFAMALLYFKQRKTDLVIVETVGGGLSDLTNAIGVPLVTVLTLLEDKPQVVETQCSILKEGTKAVLYRQSPRVMEQVQARCQELDVPLEISKPSAVKKIGQSPEGQKFSIQGKIYKFGLIGEHQLHNVALALETVQALRDCGFGFSPKSVYAGLTRTVWPGRFERVHIAPDFILDGCDNAQSCQAVAKTLVDLYPEKSILFLGGVLEHQDYSAMVEALLPLGKRFITVTPSAPTAVEGRFLADYIQGKTAYPVISVAEVDVAVETALELAGPEDVICSWGSLELVGEIRHILGIC